MNGGFIRNMDTEMTVTTEVVEQPVQEATEAPAENADILSNDENSSAQVDKVVPTSDGKIQNTLAEATTLEKLAEKYSTTAELLRKENSSLPASGELKAGTVIILNAQ